MKPQPKDNPYQSQDRAVYNNIKLPDDQLNMFNVPMESTLNSLGNSFANGALTPQPVIKKYAPLKDAVAEEYQNQGAIMVQFYNPPPVQVPEQSEFRSKDKL